MDKSCAKNLKITGDTIMEFFADRMKEKASHGGLGLVAVGLIILFLGGWVTYAAYAAIAYGGYQILTKG
jgi:hypothetical protein